MQNPLFIYKDYKIFPENISKWYKMKYSDKEWCIDRIIKTIDSYKHYYINNLPNNIIIEISEININIYCDL